jgi:hypothetical protein
MLLKFKLQEFDKWLEELNKISKYQIELNPDAKKDIKIQIMNNINMKKIKQNIEYISNDPLNLKKQAPNDWHRYSYEQKDNETIYTMDITGRDRLAYYIKDDIIVFSMIGHP